MEFVDLDPVVAATMPGPAPTSPVNCPDASHANRSGGADERPQDDAVGALVAFLDTDSASTFPRSAWTEFTVDADTVVYAWETQPGSGEYAVIVGTERSPDGWRRRLVAVLRLLGTAAQQICCGTDVLRVRWRHAADDCVRA